YMRWQSGDEGCTRLAIVQLYKCGLGTEEDLAAAFGRHINSVQNYLRDFTGEGIQGLMTERRGPKGQWKLTPELRGKILQIVLREGIWKLEAIQQRLLEAWQEAVSVPSIQQVLEENGLGEPTPRGVGGAGVQAELFAREPEPQLVLPLEGCAAQFREPVSTGSEPLHIPERQRTVNSNAGGEEVGAAELGRGWQRDSYSPAQRVYLDQWEQGAYNAYAGGLLFAPLLARYQFIPTLSRIITTATHEGYSLAELALTLFYLDVFGFRSLEDFKRAYAEEFGVLMGRTQSPSLFTLRRFLHKVRKLGQGEALIDEFARTYLQSGLAAWGVMYIDGHFLPYYGLYPISKGWHGVRQMPMKGSYNFLAVDERFAPWLFLIRSSSEDLLQKIPELIEKAKRIGEQAGVSRQRLGQLIVVFDREGYSAELYRYLEGKDQGAGKRRALFVSWAKYSDKWVNDLAEEQFNRVAQVTYEIREEQAMVENPEHRELKKQRAGLVSELNRLKIELADHLLEPPAKKPGTPSRSQKEVMDDIAVIEGKILLADDQLEKLPSEIRFDEAHAGEKLLKLNHEKKRFLDCIKVFVCNSKAEMCRLLLKHYDRPKEVIPALAMIVERTGYMKLEGASFQFHIARSL